MGICNGNKGMWIDAMNNFFHGLHFVSSNNAVNEFQIILAVVALSIDKSNSTTEIFVNFLC